MVKEYKNNRNIAVLEMKAKYSHIWLSSKQLLNVISSLKLISTITELNLSGNVFTDEIADMLADAVRNFTTLNTLLLESCLLQSAMVQAIISGCCSTALWTLDLSLNNFTPTVVTNIAALIDKNNGFGDLYLDGNDMIAMANANSSIALMGLTVLSIDSDMLQDVMQLYETASVNGMQPSLKLLVACNHAIKVRAEVYLQSLLRGHHIKLYKQSTVLEPNDLLMPFRLHLLSLAVSMQMYSEEVSLSWEHGSTLNATGMFNYFSSMCNIETIQFSNVTNNHVTLVEVDFISAIIKNNSKLKKIYLTNVDFLMPLCEDHAAGLAFQEQIRSCNFSSKSLKQILWALESAVNLTVLNLSGNSVDKDTAIVLSSLITNCVSLETVLLQGCSLQAKGVQILSEPLAQIKTLKFLNLSNNKLTDEAAESIIDIINGTVGLNELHIDNNLLSHQTLNKLGVACKFTRLSVLVIDAVMVTKSSVKGLENSAVNGSKINLKNHVLKLAGLIYLSKCMSCHSLLLLKDPGSDACTAVAYVKDGNIVVNWKSQNELAATGMLKLLISFKHVTNLQFYNFNISKQDVETIALLLADLNMIEQITFHGMTSRAMLRIFDCLRKCDMLKVVNVYCSNFTIEVSKSLAVLLNERKEIFHLLLYACLLGTSDITTIVSSLNIAANLECLILQSNYITSGAAENIAGIISKKCHTFLIGYNRLEANGVTTLLGNLKELERLSLSSNNVTETIADHIVCVVLKNTGLRLLDLSKVCVNAHDSIKLIKALQSLTYLQCLNLQNNYIEKDVANYLAAVIASHKDLQIFYVGYNHFQSNGVNILAKALCMLKRLKELDIMNTGISS